MMNTNQEDGKDNKTTIRRIADNIRDRFDLGEDNATQDEVVGSITKGVEFRGTNIWVLICATFIASLGLNVNSTAVIIGAMLISPLMGPIIGMGLSLGINDFMLLKKSLRNFFWMFLVSAVTSTIFFMISPYSSAQSELLARTSPTTYDVLIAFVGGIAGMLAQTRRDKNAAGTVISGVAIATALMPPLCTVGFGIANAEPRYIFGALYLFLINTVFIAVASYLMVTFLKYEKKIEFHTTVRKRMRRYVLMGVIIVIVPSLFMTINIMRKTKFESNVDRYVNNVFQFNKTMLVDYDISYEGRNSSVVVRLVGEALSQNVIDNAAAQMASYGLENTKLVVRQLDESERIDFSKIQKSYAEIIDEKNNTISELERRLSSVQAADTIAVADISKELRHITGQVEQMSLSKHVLYDTEGVAADTTYIVTIVPVGGVRNIDTEKIKSWLNTRLKTNDITIFVESND